MAPFSPPLYFSPMFTVALYRLKMPTDTAPAQSELSDLEKIIKLPP